MLELNYIYVRTKLWEKKLNLNPRYDIVPSFTFLRYWSFSHMISALFVLIHSWSHGHGPAYRMSNNLD